MNTVTAELQDLAIKFTTNYGVPKSNIFPVLTQNKLSNARTINMLLALYSVSHRDALISCWDLLALTQHHSK